MTKPELSQDQTVALKLFAKATAPNHDMWRLSGPAQATLRQAILQGLTGTKLSKAKCGVTALQTKLFELSQAPTDVCLARQYDHVSAWVKETFRGEA